MHGVSSCWSTSRRGVPLDRALGAIVKWWFSVRAAAPLRALLSKHHMISGIKLHTKSVYGCIRLKHTPTHTHWNTAKSKAPLCCVYMNTARPHRGGGCLWGFQVAYCRKYQTAKCVSHRNSGRLSKEMSSKFSFEKQLNVLLTSNQFEPVFVSQTETM